MARARSSRRSRGNVVTIPWDKEEAGGGGFLIPDGEYRMKLTEASQETSKDGNPYIRFVFLGLEGKGKGKVFFLNGSMLPQALWRLRGYLTALGQEVPEEAEDLDLDALAADEPEVVGVVESERWEGKDRSKLVDLINGEDEEEEEEAPRSRRAAKGRGKKKATKLATEDVREMNEDELQDVIDKHELDVDLSEHKTPRKKAAAVIVALEENDLLED